MHEGLCRHWDRFVWIVVPVEPEVQEWGQQAWTAPEHGADGKLEEWRQWKLDTQSGSHLLAKLEIAGPIAEMGILREQQTEMVVLGKP